ncbi:MAG: hypothetical protein PHT33_03395, partial [bacterium]|nr:hypothetical protein [bacterium]
MRYLKSCLFAVLFVVVTRMPMEAAGVAVGGSVSNQASISYASESGTPYSSVSNTVATSVLQGYGVTLVPEKTAADVQAGGETLLGFSLTNTGNGSDSFSLT